MSACLVSAALLVDADPIPPTSEQPAVLEVRGRVVCLPEEMHARYGTELVSGHTHVWGFRTEAGKTYTLLETKMSEALLKDPQVRTRELLLKARLLPESNVLDVTRTRSLRDGIVYDLFYFCSVCNIESVSPGPCPCCQGTVELTEKPLGKY